MTPHEIDFLMHCYVSPSTIFNRIDAPIMAKETIPKFLELDLISVYKDEQGNACHKCYRATPRGRAHILQLCTIGLPQAGWIDFAGNLITRDLITRDKLDKI